MHKHIFFFVWINLFHKFRNTPSMSMTLFTIHIVKTVLYSANSLVSAASLLFSFVDWPCIRDLPIKYKNKKSVLILTVHDVWQHYYHYWNIVPIFHETGEKKTLDFHFLLHIFEDDKLSKRWYHQYQHLLRVHTQWRVELFHSVKSLKLVQQNDGNFSYCFIQACNWNSFYVRINLLQSSSLSSSNFSVTKFFVFNVTNLEVNVSAVDVLRVCRIVCISVIDVSSPCSASKFIATYSWSSEYAINIFHWYCSQKIS